DRAPAHPHPARRRSQPGPRRSAPDPRRGPRPAGGRGGVRRRRGDGHSAVDRARPRDPRRLDAEDDGVAARAPVRRAPPGAARPDPLHARQRGVPVRGVARRCLRLRPQVGGRVRSRDGLPRRPAGRAVPLSQRRPGPDPRLPGPCATRRRGLRGAAHPPGDRGGQAHRRGAHLPRDRRDPLHRREHGRPPSGERAGEARSARPGGAGPLRRPARTDRPV
ncbi:MAG: Two-component transcriptional response regulator, LuxR family, partial [uncultured Solirubrobacteraceae bacterium]